MINASDLKSKKRKKITKKDQFFPTGSQGEAIFSLFGNTLITKKKDRD